MDLVDVIIVAGGVGRRFGGKKQFSEIMGVPVLKRSVSIFQDHPVVKDIVVVVPGEDIATTRKIIADMDRVSHIEPGGESRQLSVWNGLSSIAGNRLVMIHDGVRPIVSKKLIDRVVRGIKGFDACIPVLPLSDTIKEVDKGIVRRTVQRDNIYRVQTPQIFDYNMLVRAHRLAMETGVKDASDDSLLVESAGGHVSVVDGEVFNIKITFEADLILAEGILRCLSGLE